jgi:hypothetical protein
MKEENNHNNKMELGKRKGGAAAAGHRNRFVLVPILFIYLFFFARAFPICWQRNFCTFLALFRFSFPAFH